MTDTRIIQIRPGPLFERMDPYYTPIYELVIASISGGQHGPFEWRAYRGYVPQATPRNEAVQAVARFGDKLPRDEALNLIHGGELAELAQLPYAA